MKKKIIGGIAVLAIAAVTAFNVSLSAQEDNISTISLANVEALARDESSETGSLYSNGSKYCCKRDSDRTCGAATCSF